MAAYEYDGFFAAMDTFKDTQRLDDLYEGGQPPWEVWREPDGGPRTQRVDGIEALVSEPNRSNLTFGTRGFAAAMSQDTEVGVKWNVQRGWRANQAMIFGVRVGCHSCRGLHGPAGRPGCHAQDG